MMARLRWLICLFVLVMMATGCTVGDALALVGARPAAATLTGDAQRGDALFHKGKDGAPACSSCHALVAGPFSVGPALKGVGERATTRVPGLTADGYLAQSILEPKAFVVPGFRPIMYPDYAKHLSAQDVADLVAYLKTL
jgi:cytochrome c2